MRALPDRGQVPRWRRVIVAVSLVHMLQAKLLMRSMQVGYRRVVVLVVVSRRQVLPLVPLARLTVVGDVRMPVRVPDRLVLVG